jgi:hypothetical protein
MTRYRVTWTETELWEAEVDAPDKETAIDEVIRIDNGVPVKTISTGDDFEVEEVID